VADLAEPLLFDPEGNHVIDAYLHYLY